MGWIKSEIWMHSKKQSLPAFLDSERFYSWFKNHENPIHAIMYDRLNSNHE
jgi:hypothetical protein